ncbi:hypothetical protein ACFYRI_14985 [Streptomyces microflavus]|uniref:hypothetical protein n=1 Tax=Streptomyces microflavus TaxID=1919 RepID=UPI003685CCC8
MDERTITEISEGLVGETPTWQVQMTDVAGRGHVHVFPQETLAWRAAEYGIDPTDTDTLLDIILHEPFLPDLSTPEAAAADPAARTGLNVTTLNTKGAKVEPVQLHNAPTTKAARDAHLLRINNVKQDHHVQVPAGKGVKDPRAAIRGKLIDPGRVAELAGYVDAMKRQARGEAARTTPRSRPAMNPVPTLPEATDA